MTVVPASYRHYDKIATPGGVVAGGGARLKFYQLYKADEPIDPAISASAHDALLTDILPRYAEAGDLGFVILHRCGASFHFLLVQLWRGANEIWEAVYFTDEGEPGFAPFPAANPGPPHALRPTFCVWEMAIVAHEAQAWGHFLRSDRGEAAVERYLGSPFEGVA